VNVLPISASLLHMIWGGKLKWGYAGMDPPMQAFLSKMQTNAVCSPSWRVSEPAGVQLSADEADQGAEQRGEPVRAQTLGRDGRLRMAQVGPNA